MSGPWGDRYNPAARRELERQVERDDAELAAALADLRVAAKRRLTAGHLLRKHAAPLLGGAFCLGLWFGLTHERS